MNPLNRETIRELIAPQEAPCISIYQPTHRHHPDNQQDPIRFKNLVRTVEESLAQVYRGRDIRPLVAPLQQIAEDTAFWKHTLDGLAVLSNAQGTRIFQLQRPVVERAIVADNFYVKGLIRVVQSADRFHLLALSRDRAQLYAGNRYALDALTVPGMPGTLTEALGEQVTTPEQAGYSAGASRINYGIGSRKDEIKLDTERYFRAVDRVVLDGVSRPSGLPLVVVALAENASAFRAISQNPHLMPEGIAIDPGSLDADKLRTAVWSVVEPLYLKRLADLSEAYTSAAAHQKGSADLSDSCRAAVAGRVATLLVEADRIIPGRMDPTTGAIQSAELGEPDVGDLLDDLAETVLRTGGDVVLVPTERMPSKSGLAATFRY
ncbi:MAG: hypothetical protein LC104_09325 [Bacteroidales bacterium]|nr:hypothetical protein [Bacteroidales bacterium]